VCCRFGPGSQKEVSETQRALEKLARRFLPFPNGNFSPSPPPALLDKITDELLVVASDAVATVAAEVQPRPSGKSLLRLLAWVVADVRGSSSVLDKLLAETVGKRLDRQAQKVRSTLARAALVAELARSDVSTVLAGGALTASHGADRRAEIDRVEKQAYEHARREVYIGFHELEALLPGYVAPSRYPELVRIHEPVGPAALPPIPPDLAAALGAAACEEMRVRVQDEGGHRCLDPADSDVWWAVYLPSFVNDLRRERDAARLQASEADETVKITNAALERAEAAELEQSEGIRALVDRSRASLIALHDRELADVERDRGRDREQMRGAEDAVEEAQENVVRLEQEVAVVRGREEALKGVIERMIERYWAWIAHEWRTEQ
jgi:hypothetical protein